MRTQYYLYVSDAKIEMLLPQIPGASQHKVAAKFGFDIKLLAGSIESQRETLNSRVARLHVVEDYIVGVEDVGKATNTTSWIADTVEAKFLDVGDGAILFVSKIENSFIALGGSAQHLFGSMKPEAVGISVSYLPRLTSLLTRLVERSPDFLLKLPETHMEMLMDGSVGQGFAAWQEVIKHAWIESQEPAQEIVFLAKRLVTKPCAYEAGVTYTLATPLYVALV